MQNSRNELHRVRRTYKLLMRTGLRLELKLGALNNSSSHSRRGARRRTRIRLGILGAIGLGGFWCTLLLSIDAAAAATANSGITYKPTSVADGFHYGRFYHVSEPCMLEVTEKSEKGWIGRDERNPLCKQGDKELLQQNWQAALECYNKVLETNKDNAVAYAHRSIARHMVIMQRAGIQPLQFVSTFSIVVPHQESKQILDDSGEALRMHPDCAILHRNFAELVETYVHDSVKANEAAERAVELAPNDVRCLLSLADAFKRKGEAQKAFEVFKRAEKAAPNSGWVLTQRGSLFLNLGKFELAQKDERAAIAIEPNNGFAHYELGVACACTGDFKSSAATLEEAIKDLPNFYSAWQALSLSQMKTRNYRKSIQSANQGIKVAAQRRVNPYECYYQLGLANTDLLQYADALHAFDTAIRCSPERSQAYVDRAIVLSKINRYRDAMADLNHAVNLDPKNALAYRARGELYALTGQMEQSTSDLLTAKQLIAKNVMHRDEQNGNVAFSLPSAAIQKEHEQERQAAVAALPSAESRAKTIQQYDQLIAVTPKAGDLYYNRALIHMCSGDTSAASNDFSTAVTLLQPGRTALFSQLLNVTCLRRSGRPEKATAALASLAYKGKDRFLACLVNFEHGSTSEGDLLSCASGVDASIAHYFIGLRKLDGSKQAEAGKEFEWVREHADHASDEYIQALWELEQLKRGDSKQGAR